MGQKAQQVLSQTLSQKLLTDKLVDATEKAMDLNAN
jgi:hypothetical protein